MSQTDPSCIPSGDAQPGIPPSTLDVRRGSVALFLAAGSVLILEIAMTRVLSVMAWHHFAYVVISLALMGFGAASTFLTVTKRVAAGQFEGHRVGRYALAFCLATVLGFAASTKVHLNPSELSVYSLQATGVRMLLQYVLIGAPFFCAGLCICYLLSHAGDAVNRLYFADLLGAGSGAILCIAAVNSIGVESTIYAAATAGGVVAVMFAPPGRRRRLRRTSVVVTVIAAGLSVVAARRAIFPVHIPPDKFPRSMTEQPHYYKWHVVARIDVLDPVGRLAGFGGQISPRCDPALRAVPMRPVLQDGTAPSGIVNVPGGDVGKIGALDYYLQAAPYVIKPKPEHTLIIGVGGGIDVLIAQRHGAGRIVGVEINPVIVEAVKHRYADYAGRIFDRPEVSLITAEGRHYLTSTSERFDIIQLSGVDTFTALSTGAYALTENYLYTLQAMRDYWQRLRDEGLLSFSRFLLSPPRETLRLVAIQAAALDQLGVPEPDRHFVVIAGAPEERRTWAETLLKKAPFTQAEAAAYRQWADRLGFRVLYDPYHARENAFDALIRSDPAQRERLIGAYPFDIRPVSDDDPFFFQFHRWRLPPPSTGQTGTVQPGNADRFPAALAFLLFSLVQIVLLAGALILLPLVRRRGNLRPIRHKTRTFIYFGSLGLGFIMVEIALLQKYTVFVGGPVYSMAITLFALLVFSGLGSLAAQRVARAGGGSLTLILLALIAAIVGEAMFANRAIPRLMPLPHLLRCVVTILALAPLATLMGMPFPSGLRVAQRLGHAIVPWAWGVNAVATTFGALVCVLLSMAWGFTNSLYCAAAVYLIAMCMRLGHVGRRPDRPRADAQTEPGH